VSFPAPSEKQARILWASLTALALAVCVGLIGVLCWALSVLINTLSPVLLPLAIAGILACILDPVVDFIESRVRIPRARAILLVFLLGLAIVLMLLATVVPKLVVEISQLLDGAPELAAKFRLKLSDWLAMSPMARKAKDVWDSSLGESVQKTLADFVPIASAWVLGRLAVVASWAGYLVGIALVPVYLFYFLLDKAGIEQRWTDYLPVTESRVKRELVFVLTSINDCVIVFFRGQILVALCSGTLLILGLSALGLNYAVLLGAMAGLLGIIPYLGIMVSIVPALILAAVQFGDWWHPALVLGVFVLVQTLEGFVYSPRIIGNRVGLSPLTIMIAVMTGAALLGGILGGMLAIPLTAALRTLMFRYVWKRPGFNPP
jgi:predicted PurR-regulated permease PerM